MNASLSTTFPSSSPSSPVDDSRPGRTARLLRILGAMAIGGSGVLYMLQGLYNTNTDLRNWVYLALMAALGAGGIFSQRLMQDSKGARLFFALAALLIPVQFSQLGGMVLGFFSGATTALQWFAISAPQAPLLLAIGALSVVAAIALSFAGFSVLARAAAKPLTLVFVAMNGLLLLPFRESLAILPVFTALIALATVLEMRIFRRDVVFQTLEGVGVRLMVLLPVAIAVCRSAFYASDTMGVSSILAVCAVLLHYLAGCQGTLGANRYVREFLWLMSFTLLLPATVACAHELFGHSQSLLMQLSKPWLSAVYTLPVLACSLYFSARAKLLSLFYQLVAGAVLCISIAWVLDVGDIAAESALWCAAIVTLCHGLVRRQKITFVTGVLTTLGLSSHLVYSAVHNIHVNLWLALAIGGLVLMLLSSICEKHGRKWLLNSREYWQQFNEWESR